MGNCNWLKLEVKVFNTKGLNLCTETQWQALNKESTSKAFDASFVYLNDPRYWTMDEIRAAGNTLNDVKESFGGIEMNLRATVQLSLLTQLMGSKSFTSNEVNCTTNFIYRAGSAVYELTSPAGDLSLVANGSAYVLQDNLSNSYQRRWL